MALFGIAAASLSTSRGCPFPYARVAGHATTQPTSKPVLTWTLQRGLHIVEFDIPLVANGSTGKPIEDDDTASTASESTTSDASSTAGDDGRPKSSSTNHDIYHALASSNSSDGPMFSSKPKNAPNQKSRDRKAIQQLNYELGKELALQEQKRLYRKEKKKDRLKNGMTKNVHSITVWLEDSGLTSAEDAVTDDTERASDGVVSEAASDRVVSTERASDRVVSKAASDGDDATSASDRVVSTERASDGVVSKAASDGDDATSASDRVVSKAASDGDGHFLFLSPRRFSSGALVLCIELSLSPFYSFAYALACHIENGEYTQAASGRPKRGDRKQKSYVEPDSAQNDAMMQEDDSAAISIAAKRDSRKKRKVDGDGGDDDDDEGDENNRRGNGGGGGGGGGGNSDGEDSVDEYIDVSYFDERNTWCPRHVLPSGYAPSPTGAVIIGSTRNEESQQPKVVVHDGMAAEVDNCYVRTETLPPSVYMQGLGHRAMYPPMPSETWVSGEDGKLREQTSEHEPLGSTLVAEDTPNRDVQRSSVPPLQFSSIGHHDPASGISAAEPDASFLPCTPSELLDFSDSSSEIIRDSDDIVLIRRTYKFSIDRTASDDTSAAAASMQQDDTSAAAASLQQDDTSAASAELKPAAAAAELKPAAASAELKPAAAAAEHHDDDAVDSEDEESSVDEDPLSFRNIRGRNLVVTGNCGGINLTQTAVVASLTHQDVQCTLLPSNKASDADLIFAGPRPWEGLYEDTRSSSDARVYKAEFSDKVRSMKDLKTTLENLPIIAQPQSYRQDNEVAGEPHPFNWNPSPTVMEDKQISTDSYLQQNAYVCRRTGCFKMARNNGAYVYERQSPPEMCTNHGNNRIGEDETRSYSHQCCEFMMKSGVSVDDTGDNSFKRKEEWAKHVDEDDSGWHKSVKILVRKVTRTRTQFHQACIHGKEHRKCTTCGKCTHGYSWPMAQCITCYPNVACKNCGTEPKHALTAKYLGSCAPCHRLLSGVYRAEVSAKNSIKKAGFTFVQIGRVHGVCQETGEEVFFLPDGIIIVGRFICLYENDENGHIYYKRLRELVRMLFIIGYLELKYPGMKILVLRNDSKHRRGDEPAQEKQNAKIVDILNLHKDMSEEAYESMPEVSLNYVDYSRQNVHVQRAVRSGRFGLISYYDS